MITSVRMGSIEHSLYRLELDSEFEKATGFVPVSNFARMNSKAIPTILRTAKIAATISGSRRDANIRKTNVSRIELKSIYEEIYHA